MKLLKCKYISVALLLFISCNEKFLEVLPTGSLSDDKLTTKAGIEGSLIGAYAILTGRGYDFYSGSTNWFWGSVLGGDSNKGSNFGDQAQMNEVQSYATLKTNSSLIIKYRTSYEGITRANTTLALLAKASESITEADKKRIAGEARFLRGHYYFDLKKIFNNTPFIDENTGGAIVKNDIDLWTKIEADFLYAYDNLPETNKDLARANKWAAGAYLAKALLFQKKYSQAKIIFDEVIAKGKTTGGLKYGLMEKFGDLFRAPTCDNNKESIFAIEAVVNTGDPANANMDFILNYPFRGGPATCCGFNQPSFDLVNSFRTDANGLPLSDGSYNREGNAVKSDMTLLSTQHFTPDAGNLDARLDHSAGRRGIPYWNWGDHPGAGWIREQSYAGPYSPKKFVYQKGDVVEGNIFQVLTVTGNNYSVIRLADVLLMSAEVEVELGNLEAARSLVNQVRARAANADGFVTRNGNPAAKYVVGLYNTPWTTQVAAREAVYFERKLELSGEGHRFFDLVRWGVAKKVLDDYAANEATQLSTAFGSVKFTSGKSEYQPIPQQEIDLAGAANLSQNPKY